MRENVEEIILRLLKVELKIMLFKLHCSF